MVSRAPGFYRPVAVAKPPNAQAFSDVTAKGFARSALVVVVAYLAALAAAAIVARVMGPAAHPLATIAAADAAATLAVFAFSVACNNSSVYDPYWSVAPIVIAPYLALLPQASGAPAARRILVCALVIVWGVRLTYNWARGWQGMHHEDWRYVDLRRTTGRAYWLVSLVGLHMFPTVAVYLGCLPLYHALTTGTQPLNALDILAAGVTLGATVIEAVADEQLRAFRATRPEPGAILQTGLWAYSRHPNYFGEISFWWGLFLFGVAADPGALWTAVGGVAMAALFTIVSIPLAEKRSLARRPSFAQHMERVSMLVPWFPRQPRGG